MGLRRCAEVDLTVGDGEFFAKSRAFLMDARLRVQMRAELSRLHRRIGVTTIYVTHDQTEAMTLGDRIAVLHEGPIRKTGTPRKLYPRPANLCVALFIGPPPENLFDARPRGGTLEMLGRSFDVADGLRRRLERATEALVVGIRPEHLPVEPRRITGAIEKEQPYPNPLPAAVAVVSHPAETGVLSLVCPLDHDLPHQVRSICVQPNV